MTLSVRQPPYKIPEYSLTGDLLAYLACGLQYRYHNRGSLPPSKPVQLWFGLFIHGVMEEAYLHWKENSQRRRFPWSWDPEIRVIELRINRRLRARGLIAPPGLFCPYDDSFTQQGLCPDARHPHQLIASQRAEAALNTWGPHLFPLVDEPEVRLKGIRDMPNYRRGVSRCNYYGVTGVVDVLSSVNLQGAPPGNLILHHLHQDSAQFQHAIASLASSEYEIIIDYKGMRRPSTDDRMWQHHEWQILTYAWLRSQQPQAKRVLTGIIFYLNELVLSVEDAKILQDDVMNDSTDIMPQALDLENIQNWRSNTPPPSLSRLLKERRSIRIMPVDEVHVQDSLQEFDLVIGEIEGRVLSEMSGSSISQSWDPNPISRNCTACDFKTFCRRPAPGPYRPTVP